MPSFYDISKYFNADDFWNKGPEFCKKIKKILINNHIKIGDLIYINIASYHPELCFGLVLQNNAVYFGEVGWKLPTARREIAGTLANNNIKYNKLYLEMKNNEVFASIFFYGETDQMIDEFIKYNLWDLNYNYGISLSYSEEEESNSSDNECDCPPDCSVWVLPCSEGAAAGEI